MKQDITHLLSKYGRILCLGMLTAFAVAACQKDDRTVVLNAVISEQTNSNAKVYVEGNTAYWQHGDKVKVNGTECNVSVTAPSTTTARIINVGAADKYTAGYPSEYTTHVNDGSLKIEIPHDHVYEVANRYDGTGATAQRVVSPMAAYTEDGTTLMFQNVASLLEVEIENESIDHEMTLYAVEVVSDNAPLSGILPVGFDEEGAVTVNPSDATATQKSVIMHFTGVGSSVVLDKSSGSGTKTAKVYIPILPILEGKKSNLTVHVMATGDDDKKYTFHGESAAAQGVWIARNAMGSISCKLNSSTCDGENKLFWGKGTSTCPYIIENEADLIRLRDTVNTFIISGTNDNGYNNSSVYYRQTQNITLNETNWGAPTNKAIGDGSGSNKKYFNANYNGGGHWVELKITGIESSDITTTSYIGLFGAVGGGGKIENLTMRGEINAVADNIAQSIYLGTVAAFVTGDFTIKKCCNEISFTSFSVKNTGNYHYCGGICGYVNSGTVTFDHDTNKAVINGIGYNTYYIGGICGATTSGCDVEAKYCCNQGRIIATHTGSVGFNAGGIIGYVGSTTTFDHCSNKEYSISGEIVSSVSSTKPGCGGIAGYCATSTSKFSDCINEGEIYSTSTNVGGILGYSTSEVEFTDCSNSGMIISSAGNIGGIVGHSSNKCTITDCTNESSGTITITSGTYGGGIIGIYDANNTYKLSVIRCTNNSSVKCSSIGGGMLGGGRKVSIVDCNNYGTISGYNNSRGNKMGGIVGQLDSDCDGSDISHCFNFSDVISYYTGNTESNCGGIMGYLTCGADVAVTIKNCGVADCNIGGTKANGANNAGIVATVYNGNSKKCTLSVSNCYVSSTVSVKGNVYTCGIIGKSATDKNRIRLYNCYFGGTLMTNSTTYAIGTLNVNSTNEGIIENCYARADCFDGTGTHYFVRKYGTASTEPSAYTNAPDLCAFFDTDGNLYKDNAKNMQTTITVNTTSGISNLGNALRKWQEVNSDYTEWETGNVPTLK